MFFTVFSFPSYPGQWIECCNHFVWIWEYLLPQWQTFVSSDLFEDLNLSWNLFLGFGFFLVFPLRIWSARGLGSELTFLKSVFVFLYISRISSCRTMFILSPLLIMNYHKMSIHVNPTQVKHWSSISTTETAPHPTPTPPPPPPPTKHYAKNETRFAWVWRFGIIVCTLLCVALSLNIVGDIPPWFL